MKGLIEDIQAANKLAACFRKDDSQLVFVLLTRIEFLNDVNFRLRGKVGVRRIDLGSKNSTEDDLTQSAQNIEGYKVLDYRKFSQVLKRMQADADVALQIQITMRFFTVSVCCLELLVL